MTTIDAPPEIERYCRTCWYSLRGLASPRCPECGRAFDPDRPATFADRPKRAFKLRQCGKWGLIALGLLPFEFAACGAAYETLGEALQSLCVLVLLMGLVLIALSMPLGRPRITATVVVLLALVSIPPQIWLSIRLQRMKAEAGSIAAFVDQARAASGAYPANLAGYSFRRPNLASNIGYYPGQGPGGYSIHVWVIQRGISHDYSPARGWHYYPD